MSDTLSRQSKSRELEGCSSNTESSKEWDLARGRTLWRGTHTSKVCSQPLSKLHFGSQLNYFFARHDKEFILIADYSRSTQVYSEVNAPYEKIRKIDETELRSVAERLRAGKNFAKSQIEALNRKLELISSANNSLEEKLDVINSELEIIEEYEDDIQTLDRYAIELDFIANMACDNDIFVGFEISCPTEKDIVDC